MRGDEVIFARGFGLADVAKKTRVTPDTRFFIGSTTKAFTATLVGMLVVGDRGASVIAHAHDDTRLLNAGRSDRVTLQIVGWPEVGFWEVSHSVWIVGHPEVRCL